jgi:inhibitor of cysteine peptidase
MQANASTITVPRTVKPATILVTLFVVAVVAVGAIALANVRTASPAPTALGPAEAGSSVTLEVGGELTISLPANPSTGYSWVVSAINPALLTQIGEPEFSADSDLIGAGGTMTFHFEGTAVGQDSLQLEYLRTWEEAAPLETYNVTVSVR